MALIGNNNEEKIWNYLYSKLKNAYGVAGIMGNLKAESDLKPNNLQNSYEQKLGYTDESYTTAVDNGSYDNFIYDKAGYGLVQYTFWSLKKSVYDYAKSTNRSIGDLEMQLEHICKMLSTDYKSSVWDVCKIATSVRQASDAMLLKFERPTDQSEHVRTKRASYGQTFYDRYSKNVTKKNANNTNKKENGGISMGYTNSSLVNCVVKSPNHSGTRTHSIDRITPHCVVGQLTAEGIGSCFTSSSVEASCNYGIGRDGRVVLCVDEANRSWCSSSNSNDQRAVTIECASDTYHPYAMNNAVYNKLVDLCVDICRRNGKKKLLWLGSEEKALNYSPKSDEMVLTAHRFFSYKSCPGDWLYSRYGNLASAVTKKLGGTTSTPSNPTTNTTIYRVRKTWNDSKSQIGAYKNLSNAKAIADKNKGYTVFDEKGKAVYTSKTTTTAKPTKQTFTPYTVRVTVDALNIRKGAGTNYGTNGCIRDRGVYTIVAESTGSGANKWGKLKSGVGWISLDYTKKEK